MKQTIRDPARMAVPPHQRMRTVTGDVMDPADISPAVDGADVVLSALGLLLASTG